MYWVNMYIAILYNYYLIKFGTFRQQLHQHRNTTKYAHLGQVYQFVPVTIGCWPKDYTLHQGAWKEDCIGDL